MAGPDHRAASASGADGHGLRRGDPCDLAFPDPAGNRVYAPCPLGGSAERTPIPICILEIFISAAPCELDETAFPDGYSRPSFVVRHLIPAIAPCVWVTGLLCLIFLWVEVASARILMITCGESIAMSINALSTFQTDIGLVRTMIVASLVPCLGMICFLRTNIAWGFTIAA